MGSIKLNSIHGGADGSSPTRNLKPRRLNIGRTSTTSTRAYIHTLASLSISVHFSVDEESAIIEATQSPVTSNEVRVYSFLRVNSGERESCWLPPSSPVLCATYPHDLLETIFIRQSVFTAELR